MKGMVDRNGGGVKIEEKSNRSEKETVKGRNERKVYRTQDGNDGNRRRSRVEVESETENEESSVPF